MSALAAATRRVPFSNGTEGYGWMDKWCAYCVHDHEVHAGGGPGCGIICAALLAGRCSCGWASPVLHDRRTTVQAWDQHKREEMGK